MYENGGNLICCNKEIYFDADILNYNIIYGEWQEIADEFYTKASVSYDETFENLDDLCKDDKGLDWGENFIMDALSIAVKKLNDYKIYDIDISLFYQDYFYKYNYFQNYFQEIEDKWAEIEIQAEHLDEYRTQRRQSRGKFGGYGVDGIVKAGALNIATGALHGTFNLIGKGISSLMDASKKSDIFKNPDTKSTIILGIYWSIFDIHRAFVEVLNEKLDIDIYAISSDNEKKAERLLNNLKNGNFDENTKQEIIIEILTLNPYNKDIYHYLIDTQGDSDNKIEEFANFFHINLKDYKFQLILDKYNSYDWSEEQKAIDGLNQLQEYSQYLGVPNNEYIEEIKNILIIFDKNARTVNGMEYKTREEADIAREEFKKIEEILKELDIEDEKSIKNTISKLEKETNFKSSIKDEEIKKLKLKLDEIDKDARTVNGVEYKTREEADEQKNKLIIDEYNNISKSEKFFRSNIVLSIITSIFTSIFRFAILYIIFIMIITFFHFHFEASTLGWIMIAMIVISISGGFSEGKEKFYEIKEKRDIFEKSIKEAQKKGGE